MAYMANSYLDLIDNSILEEKKVLIQKYVHGFDKRIQG